MNTPKNKKTVHLLCLFGILFCNVSFTYFEKLPEIAETLLSLIVFLGIGSAGVFLYSDRLSNNFIVTKPKLHRKNFSKETSFLTLLILASGIAMALLFLIPSWYSIHSGFKLTLDPLFGSENIISDFKKHGWWVVLYALPAPWLEELIFRKGLFSLFVRHSVPGASLLVSFLFAAAHDKKDFIGFIWIFLTSFLFNYLYLRTGRVRNTVLLHYSYDLSLFGIIPLSLSLFGSNAGWILLLPSLGTIIFLMFKLHSYSRKYFTELKPLEKSGSFDSLAYGATLVVILLRVFTYRF